jgi:hypothetical protein
LWAWDEDQQQSDFLAVLDADNGEVLRTALTGTKGGRSHHTEHVMPKGGFLFANGFGAGRTWIFDLRNPLKPSVLSDFGDANGMMHAHSFERLPNGNVLATYQRAIITTRRPAASPRSPGTAALSARLRPWNRRTRRSFAPTAWRSCRSSTVS